MLSRTLHDRWAVQSGHMMLGLPYAHVTEHSVIHRMFVGPGARRRAERWASRESRTSSQRPRNTA